jgi:hypothetical protein
VTIQFVVKRDKITVVKEFGPRRKCEEAMVLKTDGTADSVTATNTAFMFNLYIGIKIFPYVEKKSPRLGQKRKPW